MVSTKKIVDNLLKVFFVFAFTLLPLAGLFHLPIYLFIFSGLLLITSNVLNNKNFAKNFGILNVIFILLYLIQIIGFFLHPSHANNQFALEQKASFLFVPFLLSGVIEIKKKNWELAVKGFIVGITVSLFYCLVYAFYSFLNNHQQSVFFYHRYSGAIDANAIYLSVYVFIAISYVVFYSAKGLFKIKTFWLFVLLIFLYMNLLLLSSKMVITIGSILLIYLLITVWKIKHAKILSISFILLIAVLLSVTSNPVERRFIQIRTNQYHSVLHATDFTNYPFNGLDLRILLWRMSIESLSENNAWLLGFYGTDYHQFIKQKMLTYHLYAGDKSTNDSGYLEYNVHNQYMENLMQYGLVGLFLITSLLCIVFCYSLKSKNDMLLIFTILFSLAFFTESFLETQAGILIFTLFIYGEWKYAKELVNN